tara:strand:+ start:107 stop:325 length:219 start_codon:yes stop_codon:yes gene_type:complete
MDPSDKLADERHNQVMAAVISIHDRLDQLNGRTRGTEQGIAVLADRSSRSNALSWSSIGAVIAGALYWMMTR